MVQATRRKTRRRYRWLLLVLLTAVFFRLYEITEIPPGLTHDEADHGISAWSVANGQRPLYFTVGYGREPFYDYSTAVLMSFLGPTYLAGRLTAVFFSLLLIAATTTWTRLAFGQRYFGQSIFGENTALFTAAGLAISFWPVMTARHALRSVTLPALFAVATLLYWGGLQKAASPRHRASSLTRFLLAGLLLGLAFYTYIPSRLLWAIFPALLGYLALVNRPLFRRAWRGSALMLLVAALIGVPLFRYLLLHPQAETRIVELSRPLTAVAKGNFTPLLQNTAASLGLFTVTGDTAWRYNIAGRPLLQPLMGILFYIGVLVAVWHTVQRPFRWRNAACFLALVWLLLGLVPVLITGPELSMTQAIGMQPVLYLFPALALATVGRLKIGKRRLAQENVAVFGVLALFGITAIVTTYDYFGKWANAPQVRVQYETTLVTALRYLDESEKDAAAISTTQPGRFHSQAVAQGIVADDEELHLRWFNATNSLLLPQVPESHVVLSGFAPLDPALAGYFETAVLEATLPLRTTDLNRPLSIYRVNGPAMLARWQTQFETAVPEAAVPADFGHVVEFLGVDLQTPVVSPGAEGRVATLWRPKQSINDAILFTHVLGADGIPIAQDDRLGAASDAWYAGDVFIQLHRFTLPPETAAGQYSLVVGLYTCPDPDNLCKSGRRLPLVGGETANNDTLHLGSLTVTP